jgi:hypothetical protein
MTHNHREQTGVPWKSLVEKEYKKVCGRVMESSERQQKKEEENGNGRIETSL